MKIAYHISSLLLRVDPAFRASVAAEVEALGIAEIALNDESGKIIVTLETESEDRIVRAMSDMQHMKGVISAALVYHQAVTAEEPKHIPDTATGVLSGVNA